MNALELKALIIAAKDWQSEAVTVPEWGGVTVYIRTLTARDRGVYEAALLTFDSEGKQGVNAANIASIRERLVCLCLVDEFGERIFTDAELAELAAKDNGVIVRLHEIAQRLNTLDAKAVEAVQKNSLGTPAVDSYSSLPAISNAPSLSLNHVSVATN